MSSNCWKTSGGEEEGWGKGEGRGELGSGEAEESADLSVAVFSKKKIQKAFTEGRGGHKRGFITGV